MKRLTRVAALMLALVLSGAPGAVLAASTGAGGWSTLGRAVIDGFSAFVPTELVRQLEGTQALDSGNDGRLTFLLLGSDSRGGGVERTDTIIVASLRGSTISALSIPRDIARVPNPAGGTFGPRVNAILKELSRGRTLEQGLVEFERVIENLLQIEIDYYALVKFDGFQHLVAEIEPVSMDIPRAIADSRYWDDPNQISGVYFPAASGYDLYAWQPGSNPLCNGLWRNQAEPIPSSYWCRRAMPYVRSRKSTSDFVRARRQQNFVVAAMRRVINRGDGSLGSLIERAAWEKGRGTLATDIPLTASNALDLYRRLSGAGVGIQVVLAPHKYAKHIPGGTAYELDLAAVRQLTREWFGGSDNPSTPPATTLPTAPPPGTTAQPTAGPTAAPGSSATPAPGTSPMPTAQPTPMPTVLPSSALPSSTPRPGGPTSGPTTAPGGASPSVPPVAGLVSPPAAGQPTTAPGAGAQAESSPPGNTSQVPPVGDAELVGPLLLVAAIVLVGVAAALALLLRPSGRNLRGGR